MLQIYLDGLISKLLEKARNTLCPVTESDALDCLKGPTQDASDAVLALFVYARSISLPLGEPLLVVVDSLCKFLEMKKLLFSAENKMRI